MAVYTVCAPITQKTKAGKSKTTTKCTSWAVLYCSTFEADAGLYWVGKKGKCNKKCKAQNQNKKWTCGQQQINNDTSTNSVELTGKQVKDGYIQVKAVSARGCDALKPKCKKFGPVGPLPN